jgi:hypothetical protein
VVGGGRGRVRVMSRRAAVVAWDGDVLRHDLQH